MDFGIAVETALVYRARRATRFPGRPQFLAPELLCGAMPSVRGPTSTRWASSSSRCSPAACRSTTTTRRGSCAGSSSEAAPKVETLRPDLPPELRDILERAIAKDPEARFPDATALVRRHLGLRGTGPRPGPRRGLGHPRPHGQADGDPGGQQVPRGDVRPDRDAPHHPEDGDLRDRRRARHDLPARAGIGRARQPDPRGRRGRPDPPPGRERHRRDRGEDGPGHHHGRRLRGRPLRQAHGRRLGLQDRSPWWRRRCARPAARSSASSRSSTSAGATSPRRTRSSWPRSARTPRSPSKACGSTRPPSARRRRERRRGDPPGVAPLLNPTTWPETPGFESAPLRWRSEEPGLLVYAVEARAGSLALLLVEDARALEDAVGPHRPRLAARPLAPPVGGAVGDRPPRRRARARHLRDRRPVGRRPDRAGGARRPGALPAALRAPRPLRGARVRRGFRGRPRDRRGRPARPRLAAGSSGSSPPDKAASPEKAVQRLARTCETQALSAAFATLVAEWKKAGVSPGARDVFLLAAKRRV